MAAMPLYEYECRACDKRFDRLTTVAAADDAVCPRCGAVDARRLISVIAGRTGRAEAPAPVCGEGACGACS
jgi:putative FmdB family regulatory protein